MQMKAAIFTEPNTPFRAGKLKLEQMITRRYRLDQINEAFADLLSGELARGIIVM